MYSSILGKVRTKGEAAALLRFIDILSNSLYKTDKTRYEEVVKKLPGGELTGELVDQLEKTQDRGEWLKGLREEVKKMRILRLEVAVELPEVGWSEINEWVKTKVGNDVVMELETDVNLVAGAKITFGGRYWEKSLAGKLDEVLGGYRKEKVNESEHV